ncbi:MAG: Fic family protein [Phycisphaerae bacterium]|nr:Fic family protein [Phycisphaerae bacterium]
MKKPAIPPNLAELLQELEASDRTSAVLATIGGEDRRTKYLHWDKLRYLQPPDNLSHQEWWCRIKLHRLIQQKQMPLKDTEGRNFAYVLTDPIPQRLHFIDQHAAGRIQMPEPITNPETKDQYLVGSLIEEAITSSQLEGAATTRPVAKEMIRVGRPPRDRSEQMILNNFRTMQRIGELKGERLSEELVFNIHRLVTQEALDNPSAAGRFRRVDERIDVGDHLGNVFHLPPPADQLAKRISAMCDFANGKIPREFVHPVIRAIVLHFWLAYDHPFVDGNGRTARALFYWSMLHHGYWLCEFISISEIILRAPVKYGRAFLYTETDGNDLTYFLLYHLDVIHRAIEQLHEYLKRKTDQYLDIERQLRGIAAFNHRQRALLSHALRHPYHHYSIASHQRSHNVVYETARIDLRILVERGLLDVKKIGREYCYTPARDLQDKLRRLS